MYRSLQLGVMMSEEYQRLESLERAVANMVRVGVVKSVQSDKAVVTIGGNETAPIPWMVARANGTREWSAPAIGEQVVVLAPGGVIEDAFIGGALYQDKFAALSSNQNKHIQRYANGATIEHDDNSGDLTFNMLGNITFKTPLGVFTIAPSGITNTTPMVSNSGEVTSVGNMTSAAEMSDHKGSMSSMRDIYNNHTHTETDNVTNVPNQPM